MARDHTDHIPIANIRNDHLSDVNLDWRFKDKMRTVNVTTNGLRFTWEKVTGWKDDRAGRFGRLWVIRYDGNSQWHVAESFFLTRPRDNISTVINLEVEPGEEIGYFIAATIQSVRSAIRRWTAPGKPPPPPDDKIPDIEDVVPVHPGTLSVLGWEIRPTDIESVTVNTATQSVRSDWKRLDEASFPYHSLERDGEIDPEYIGVIWMVVPAGFVQALPDGGYWAAPTEQLHTERERNESSWTFGHITDDGLRVPKNGEVFGVFIAGPSRHTPDRPEYRYRGLVHFFRWTDGECAFLSREADENEPPSTGEYDRGFAAGLEAAIRAIEDID